MADSKISRVRSKISVAIVNNALSETIDQLMITGNDETSDIMEVDLEKLLESFDGNKSNNSITDDIKIPRRRRSRTKSKAIKCPGFQTMDGNKTNTSDQTTDKNDLDNTIKKVCDGELFELDLKKMNLTDSHLQSIFDSLVMARKRCELKSLILTRNSITDQGAEIIANNLSSFSHCLERLDLNQNDIGENGALAILKSISEGKDLLLYRIDLSWNGDITTKTKLSIIEKLLENIIRISITRISYIEPELYLHSQALGNDGIVYLCRLLHGNTCLRRLYLGDNDISEKGAEALVSLMESNFTITNIDLEENYDLDPIFKDQIGAFLVRNRSIGNLYLNRYALSDGPIVHRSATSEVIFAKDMLTIPVKSVALKKMKNRSDFEREITSRFSDRCSTVLIGHIIEVIGWHVPKNESKFSEYLYETISKSNHKDFSSIDLPYTAADVPENCYILVMPQGSRSLWLALGSQRIARYDISAALRISKQILVRLKALHSANLVHGDLKHRNLIFLNDLSTELLICDLDASLAFDSFRFNDVKRSTAYCPPELIRADIKSKQLVVKPSFDIWSFGVMLFELLSGRHLFPQDVNDDNMIDDLDLNKLATWQSLNDSLIANIVTDDAICKFTDIQYILRWCLQGDPIERPSVDQLLSHNCFGGLESTPPESLVQYNIFPSSLPLFNKHPSRMRYHVFISHFQMEASGDVGTLYYLFERFGIYAWRDMNTSEITEAAMRQGVYDSDLFILFLTNAVLSRYFCLKEMGWAIEFSKPIIIIVEQDDRFWPWDFLRWTNDHCDRIPGSQSSWTKGWLQNNYSSIQNNHPAVVQMILEHHSNGLMLPFRRREFEVLSMVQEVFRRGETHVSWCLPTITKQNVKCNSINSKKIQIIAASSLDSVKLLSDQLKEDLGKLSTTMVEFVDNDPTHILVLLTDQVLDSCFNELNVAAENFKKRTVFIYSQYHGWDFRDFYNRPDSNVKNFIASNEALAMRSLDYERKAVLLEVLKRMNY